jgi:hypothetical protein
MNLHPILESLSHGDKRMIQGVEEVIRILNKDNTLFPIIIEGIINENELIAMRSADAIEKLTINNPEWLQPYKNTLIKLVNDVKQQEVRWHLCQFIPRLTLSLKERIELTEYFKFYLTDKSRIVVTFTMQALVDLAGNDSTMKSDVRPIIEKLMKVGSSAMQSRGRKLLLKLDS